eukprot:15365966-Ditylum_brightwellii.AAC.1
MDGNVDPTNNAKSSSNATPGFTEGEYWEELFPQSAPVEEHTIMFQAPAPTVPKEKHDHTPKEFNYDFTMEREGSTEKIRTHLRNCYGQKKLQKIYMS